MTDGRDEKAAVSPPAGESGKRFSAFWTGKGPRGLALATVSLIGGGVAVLALHGPQPITPRFRAVDGAASAPQTTADPLMTELIRCRSLPPQATDPACDRAWDENRRRFFGEARATHVPGDPQPQYAPIPLSGTVEPIAQPEFPATKGD